MLNRLLAAGLVTVASLTSAGAFDFRRSTTPGALPPLTGAARLGDAEVSINAADKRLIFKNVDGTLGYGSLLNAVPAGRQAVEQGQADALTVKRTGGLRSRSHAARAADTVNPLDFLQPGDDEAAILAGTADAAPSWNAAIASAAVGARVTLVPPAGTYRLNSDVANNGRIVFVDMSSGAQAGANYGSTLGSGVLYVSRVQYRTKTGIVTDTQGTGTVDNGNVVGSTEYVTNNGGNAALGRVFSYDNYNTTMAGTASGGDGAHSIRGYWHNLTGSAYLSWNIGVTPILPENEASASSPRTFALVMEEINPIHNGPTTPWTEFDPRLSAAGRGIPMWTSIGKSVVPDSWAPTGRKNGHINIGYAVFPSQTLNARSTPYYSGTQSPFHIGNDAVAPGGRGMYFGGNTTGLVMDMPFAGIEVRHNWPMFLNLTDSTTVLSSGRIVYAKPGMGYSWATTAGEVSVNANDQGQLLLTAPGGIVYPGKAMTTYTPSVGAGAGTITTLGAVAGRYQTQGKMVDLTITIPITTNGTGGGYIYASLPPGMVAAADFTLTGNEEANASSKMLYGRVLANADTVAIFNYDSSYAGLNGAKLQVSGRIEIK